MDTSSNLSPDELRELREIFELVDTDSSGFITVQELRKLMYTLNMRPTEQELEELFDDTSAKTSGAGSKLLAQQPATAAAAAAAATTGTTTGSTASSAINDTLHMSSSSGGSSATRTITFEQFTRVLSHRVQSEYTSEQLRNAFQIFESSDQPEGYVSTAVLRQALLNYGTQKVTPEEADRLLAAVDPENTGRMNYIDFVKMVSGE